MIKNCPICNKQFSGRKDKICCSIRCKRRLAADKLRPKAGKRNCLYCNKEYYYSENQDNWLPNGKIGRIRGCMDSSKFCCYECGKKYYTEYISDIKEKKYGDKNYNNPQKAKETSYKKYGVENISCLEETKKRKEETNLKKYGVRYIMQNKFYALKQHESAVKSGKLRISKDEALILKMLRSKFSDTMYQYHSEKYPFPCDFYIPSLDLYIEYQGYPSHGGKPYEGTEADNKRVEFWKNRSLAKNTPTRNAYDGYIKVWTESDPEKRAIAKKNHLNWLEFFNLDEFLDWFLKI